MGSSSVSIESISQVNNTSTDSSNTIITMVTVTDSGETEDSLDYPAEDTMRITTNLLEDMLGNTPSSSLEKEEEFYSASSTEDQPKPNEDIKMIFHCVENEEDSNSPLLQHTSIPTENQDPTVEESNLTTISDPAIEWYNIKMRQSTMPATKNSNISNTKRLKLLSKRYAKNNFDDERRINPHGGRGSSGFAAEQMTIESEDSIDPQTIVTSPPVPDSPTASLPVPVYEPSKSPPSKTETIFAFPPSLREEPTPRHPKKPRSERKRSVTESVKKSEVIQENCLPEYKVNTATIVVQQASITGNSPDLSGSTIEDEQTTSERKKEENIKHLLDVTNNIAIQHLHENELRYVIHV